MAARVNQDEIAADWDERGFSCGLWVDAPGQVWANFVPAVADHTVKNIGGTTARWLYGYRRS